MNSMGTKKTKRSIFPDKMPVFAEEAFNILEQVEDLTSKSDVTRRHALSFDEAEECTSQKNDITYLVKAGYNLPEVLPAEDMLTGEESKEETKEQDEEKQAPYRMVNLISSNFRLPDVEAENFLK